MTVEQKRLEEVKKGILCYEIFLKTLKATDYYDLQAITFIQLRMKELENDLNLLGGASEKGN